MAFVKMRSGANEFGSAITLLSMFEGGRNMRSKLSSRVLSVLLALVLVLSTLSTMAFAAGEKSDDVVVLYTNDVHCGVDAGTPEDTMGDANLAA